MISIKGITSSKEKGFKEDYPILYLIIRKLAQDPLYASQITTLEMATNDKIILKGKEGHPTIIWGNETEMEEKFKKLRMVYTHIIPYKGERYYQEINLEFDQQIVCSRR